MKRLIAFVSRFVSQSPYRRRGALVVGGTLLAQLAQAVGTPLLGRLYSPKIFGLWNVLQSFAGLPSAFSGMRYELAIVVCDTDEEASALAVLQALCATGAALISALVILAVGGAIAYSLGVSELRPWLYLVPALVLMNGLNQNAIYWLVRFKEFRTLAFLRISQSLGGIAVGCAMAPLSGSVAGGMISGGVFGIAAPLVLIAPRIKRQYGRILKAALSRTAISKVARKYRNFPSYVVLYGLVAVLRERGVIILLAAYYGAEAAGLYAVAYRLAYMPVQLIASSISPVVYHRLTESRADAGVIVIQTVRHLATLTIPLFSFIAFYSHDLLPAMMGERWRDAGVYAGILSIPAGMQMLSGPFERFFDLLGKQHVALAIESGYTVTALAVTLGSLASGFRVSLVLVIFAVVTVAYHLTWLTAIFAHCTLNNTELVKIAARCLLLALACSAGFAVCQGLSSRFLRVGAATAVLCLYYARELPRLTSPRGSEA